MPVLSSCCCRSIRCGSFASGIYTLLFYIFFVTACAFHMNSIFNVRENPSDYFIELLIISSMALIFSGLCVLSSVLLIVGLCVDNHQLLLPWLSSVSLATFLDLIIAFYLLSESIYCILCVFSQYQVYRGGRNPGQLNAFPDIPILRVHSPSTQENGSNVHKSSHPIIHHNGTQSSQVLNTLGLLSRNNSYSSGVKISVATIQECPVALYELSSTSEHRTSITDSTILNDEVLGDASKSNKIVKSQGGEPVTVVINSPDSDDTLETEDNVTLTEVPEEYLEVKVTDSESCAYKKTKDTHVS